ncbi:hypothetical protein [Elizabethkingia sp. JS20170427COW]|uniref:hypothetical protein n=1 Tax=Elizabethkingia sp. JS20170427COW TaxID=2583851 RepID=UPI001110130F|nr:hypothetical protein [Elizabethkingia sp. JS20170427COW]QCX52467.1 hypothetical protein FGE20_01255 [Elizabethkingia sp. JS20170427COW]
MKRKNLSILALAFTLSLSVTSCTIEINDDTTEVAPPSQDTSVMEGSGTLSGTLTKDLIIKKGNYNLEGIVKVPKGITLTIEAGANFTVSTSKSSSLVILQGAKIIAEGTADLPIVFTTANKKPGDWGGITLYGEAPIKGTNGADKALSEDGNATYYGGNDSNSNSGILRYVRVEYAGKKIGDGTSETNTFTFYSVGAGTVLENLVAYKGTDDGFEFFGGTVSASNLIAYGNYDDSFDWQDAWSGQNNKNWFAYQTVIGNFGMEIESSGNADNTAPKIDGITLIREAGTKPEVPNSPEITAIQFKKHGSGIFSNVYAEGYKNTNGQKAYAVLIQDASTEAEQLNKGKIKVSPLNYVNSDNAGVFGYAFNTSNPLSFTSDTTVKKVQGFVSGAWATVDGVDLLASLKK